MNKLILCLTLVILCSCSDKDSPAPSSGGGAPPSGPVVPAAKQNATIQEQVDSLIVQISTGKETKSTGLNKIGKLVVALNQNPASIFGVKREN